MQFLRRNGRDQWHSGTVPASNSSNSCSRSSRSGSSVAATRRVSQDLVQPCKKNSALHWLPRYTYVTPVSQHFFHSSWRRWQHQQKPDHRSRRQRIGTAAFRLSAECNREGKAPGSATCQISSGIRLDSLLSCLNQQEARIAIEKKSQYLFTLRVSVIVIHDN